MSIPDAEESLLEADSGSSGGDILIDGVDKVYGRLASRVQALDDVSLKVEKGTFVSLVGPSGCGKSTLLRLIAGLDAPTSGTIEVAGRDTEATRRRREFGMVFQQPGLFDWRTIEANVALPLQIMGVRKQERLEKARALLDLVGLSDFAKYRPRQLSGGMQQRAAIARALTFEPPFLLMDEPFGALDMMTRERMQGELIAIWSKTPGATVVFVTHSISEAVLLSDRVVVMSARPGRVTQVLDIEHDQPRSGASRDVAELVEVEARIRDLIQSQEGR